MICHGQGTDPVPRADRFIDGCCFVNGSPCPNRWYIDYSTTTPPDTVTDVANATVYDSNRVSLGTVDSLARSFVGNNPNRRQRIFEQVQGARYLCKIPALLIESLWSGGPPTRAALEAAWAADPAYQPIADFWATRGWPRDLCPTFGPGRGDDECCFREDQATNDARRANLTAVAVSVRSALNGAS